MLFNKETGKLVGIIDIDPLRDQENYCVSWRFSRWDPMDKMYFITPWEPLFDRCHIVCPD